MIKKNRLAIMGPAVLISVLFLSACNRTQAPQQPVPPVTTPPATQTQPSEQPVVTQPVIPEGQQPEQQGLPSASSIDTGEKSVQETDPVVEGHVDAVVTTDLSKTGLPEVAGVEIPEPDVPDVPENGTAEQLASGVVGCEGMQTASEVEKCNAEQYLAEQGLSVSISEADFNLLLEILSPVNVTATQEQLASEPEQPSIDDAVKALVENDDNTLVNPLEGEIDNNDTETVITYDASKCSQLSTADLQTYCNETIKLRE